MSEHENMEQAGAELEKKQAAASQAPARAEKAKKLKPDSKKSKPGVLARPSRWWREMKSELKKVQWPGKKQTLNNTWVVIVCVIFVGIFIWAFDWLAKGIIDALLSVFKG